MEYQGPTAIIKRVGIYMSTAMPTDKKRLIEELQGLEACRFELAKKTAEWHKLVAEYKNRVLHLKTEI
jgi:hypothetical protein